MILEEISEWVLVCAIGVMMVVASLPSSEIILLCWFIPFWQIVLIGLLIWVGDEILPSQMA